MISLFNRKTNKVLIGLVIGGAVFGAGALGMSGKGKNFFQKIKDKIKNMRSFLLLGIKEFKRFIFKK